MIKATIAAVYEFIISREGQSDDSITLALQKEFAFRSGTTYCLIKDLVQTVHKSRK